MKKRLLAGVLIFLIGFSFIQIMPIRQTVLAETALLSVYVTADSLSIKNGPGTSYTSIGNVVRNQRLDVLEIRNGWLRIDKGWVSGVYTNRSPILFSAYVAAESLPIKSGAGVDFTTIGTVLKGQRIDVLELRNGWLRTIKGWVSGTYTIYIKYGAFVTESSIPIKAGAGSSYSDVGTVTKNQFLDVLEARNGWLRIPQGWVSGVYTSKTPILFTAYVIADSLPLKSGPGTTYADIGTVAKNQRLDVYEFRNGWLKIAQGWVSGVYTTKTVPVLKGSVTIKYVDQAL